MKKILLISAVAMTSMVSTAFAKTAVISPTLAAPTPTVISPEQASSYSLIVKFKDSAVHKSLLSTPETTRMMVKQRMSKSSTSSENDIAIKYNVVRVGSKEYGQSKIKSLSTNSGVDVKHVRSLSLNADLIKVTNLHGKNIDHVLESLRSSGQVEYAVIDLPVKAYSFNDPSYVNDQSYFKINSAELPQGSGYGYARENTVNNLGRKIRVAVLDSGILPLEDLIDYSEGYDFVTINDESRGSDPIDYFINEDGDECSSQHGTAVTSIMLATANNGVGMVGAIDHTQVEHVQARVLGCTGGTTSDIMDGVAWVSGLSVPGVPDISAKVDVINMSLGGYSDIGCDPFSQAIFDTVRDLGVTVVVAAGNEAIPAFNSTPAACNNIVTVGALGYSGDKANFSNYGDYVDVATIGTGIVHAQNADYNFDGSGDTGDTYFKGSGTSFAAPLVAGTIANLKMKYPDLTPDQLESIIKSSTVTEQMFSCKEFGCGKGQLLANVAIEAIDNITTISSYKKAHRYEGYNTPEETTWLTEMNEYVNTCDLVKYTWGNLGTQMTDVTYKLHMSENGGELTYLETVSIPQKLYNLASNTEIGVQGCIGATCGDIMKMTGDVVKPNICL
jgi:serine protease